MDVDIYAYHLAALRSTDGVLSVTGTALADPEGTPFWEIAIRTDDNPGVRIGHPDALIALSRAEEWLAAWEKRRA